MNLYFWAMERMNGTYLLLGTNLGNKKKNLQKAIEGIEAFFGKILSRSSLYETAAWGKHDQPSFLNMVVRVPNSPNAQSSLNAIQEIEQAMGRIRIEKWKERIIDIDILYIDQCIIDSPNLLVPHPELSNRRFTLAPLAEIAPDFIHPINGKSQSQLFIECTDPLPVKKLTFSV